MSVFDKLFFDSFNTIYLRLATKNSSLLIGDIIDSTNKLPIDKQYLNLVKFIESYILVEDKTFLGLEKDIIENLKRQERLYKKQYNEKLYSLIPKAIKELEKKYPEKIETIKTEEDRQREKEQIKEFYEDVRSKEGVPDLDWPEQIKKNIEKESCNLPSMYRQILNNRR